MPEAQPSDGATQTKKSFAESLPWEVIAGLLGAVSGLSLFLSIVFDMGYFETAGLRFSDIPTTISDHVRSALLWVPQATAAAFVYVLVELMQRHFGELFAEEGLTLSNKQAAGIATIGRWAFRAFIAGAFLVVLADLLTGGQLAKYASAASTVTITYIVFKGATHLGKKKPLSPAKVILLCIFPVVTILVYNTGRAKAVEERTNPRLATITLEGQREIQLSVHRYLDRGVLGTVAEGKLVFYRWEEIKRLASVYQLPKRVNWLCTSLGVACTASVGSPKSPASAASR
ncbi:MAG: hypothetical protein ING39_08955 [Burkholderiales bacterium]|jgi:hypothetical protein|nr:hypothetical protein [Burkholderiales bacterium]